MSIASISTREIKMNKVILIQKQLIEHQSDQIILLKRKLGLINEYLSGTQSFTECAKDLSRSYGK